ncbi:hypothetical protein A2U01_0020985 [Trifolium medium]|uniref:Transmembrane protein n=1 Tax=Trifolium medium TaxID=97028 RepID=A0A392NJG6_9FABA|nr:hypothetical protein [Trifolium medium]
MSGAALRTTLVQFRRRRWWCSVLGSREFVVSLSDVQRRRWWCYVLGSREFVVSLPDVLLSAVLPQYYGELLRFLFFVVVLVTDMGLKPLTGCVVVFAFSIPFWVFSFLWWSCCFGSGGGFDTVEVVR